MDVLSHFYMALKIGMEAGNLFACFIGVFLGTTIGVLPGLGPAATISLLLPITFSLTPAQSIIMLAGIYYGSLYGGSTTSILICIPGESASIVTCLDGYQMGQKGRAGAALGISAFGSFIGGTFAVVMLMIVGPLLAEMALQFGPIEMSSVILLGLIMVSSLTSGPMIRALMMVVFGSLLGCIGEDYFTSAPRYTFGVLRLEDGLEIVSVIVGLFGISEVLLNIEQSFKERDIGKAKITGLLPTKQDWKDSAGPITRGTIGGFFLGLLPGAGGMLASFLSYAVEKKISKNPERFGTGEIAGVAGPETANNAGAGGAFIPLLSLGIPSNAVMTVLMAGLIIHGVTPGPLLMQQRPDIVWGVVGSMYLGNVMLVILNLPLIGLWVKVLKMPYVLLFPIIFVLCLIGSYSMNNSIFDVFIMIAFGIIGYLMKKFQYEPTPICLGFILAPMLEENLRQALTITKGNILIFFTHPIAAMVLSVAFLFLLSPILLKWLRLRHPWKSNF